MTKAEIRDRAAEAAFDASLDEKLPDPLREYYAKLSLFLTKQAKRISKTEGKMP